MALTKKDIVEAMQSDMGFTRHQSAELVESLLEIIKSKLESGMDCCSSSKLPTRTSQLFISTLRPPKLDAMGNTGYTRFSRD
jgi:hypothetical protein